MSQRHQPETQPEFALLSTGKPENPSNPTSSDLIYAIDALAHQVDRMASESEPDDGEFLGIATALRILTAQLSVRIRSLDPKDHAWIAKTIQAQEDLWDRRQRASVRGEPIPMA